LLFVATLFFSKKNQRKRRLRVGHEGTTDVARSPNKCANSLSLSFFFFFFFFLLLLSLAKTEKLERERVCFGERSAAKAKIMLNELNGMEWNLDIQKK